MDAIGGGGGISSVREPAEAPPEEAPAEEAAEPEAPPTNETDSVDLGEEASGADETDDGAASEDVGASEETGDEAGSENASEEGSPLVRGLTENYSGAGEADPSLAGAEAAQPPSEPRPPLASPAAAPEPAPASPAAAQPPTEPGPAPASPAAAQPPAAPEPAPASPAAAQPPAAPGPAPASPAAAQPPTEPGPAPANPAAAQKPLQLKPGETLERGAEGAKVRQLQQMLNRNGARLQTDGQLGPKTEAAIREFQRKNGLATDGVVGPQTQGALNKQTPAAARPPQGPTPGTTGPQTTRSGNPAADAARAWVNRNFKPGQTKRCADFVSTVLKQSGTAPPGFQHQNTVAGLARYGTPVSRQNLRPGDVMLFNNTYRPGPNTHTGIYIGNGQFVHRPTHNAPVRIDSLDGRYGSQRHYGGARRMTG